MELLGSQRLEAGQPAKLGFAQLATSAIALTH
jgi:hypothetical protein